MSQLSPETIWNLNEKELLTLLESGFFTPKQKKIRFYAPSFTYYKTKYYCSSPNSFPTISVTGISCALNCKHCGGKVLETMRPALTTEELFKLCLKLKQDGALGCLISGGCLPDGSVPLDKFMPALKRIKSELALTVFVHTGIINFETAASLKDAQVDAALIDIIGSEETIKKTYNLNVTVKDYANSLKALDKSGLNFVPHIIVGLNGGKLNGELEALRIISRVKPSALVIIAFMPIHGTAMAKTSPPKPADIAKVVAVARLMFPETPLILGCMRPKGALRSETDILALKAGVDAVAFPSENAVKYAESERCAIIFSSYCCAQMYIDVAGKIKK
ncbi:MAG TPA: radical SAM protein [Verrucomicrobiae bacterium]|nr:radical SAM protein [Verrucomicrobiae bacterium]